MPVARLGRCVHIFTLVALLAARSGAQTSPLPSTQPASPKNVLVIYDENKDFAGLALLDQSFKAAIGAAVSAPAPAPASASVGAGAGAGAGPRVDVFTEYLDLSRFRDPAHLVRMREYLRAKYQSRRIDLIVAVMGPSLKFVLAEELFPGTSTPIVFCGIDRRELASYSLGPGVTGVLVKREFAPTLALALRLHPGAKNVFFISGTSPFNQYWREQAEREFAAFEPRVKITYLSGLAMEDIQARVAQLPSDSVILYLHLFRDGAGKTFDPNTALNLVAQKSRAPIYVFVDQFIQGGTVGGFVFSMEAQGARTAELALRILDGEKPSAISLSEAGTNVYMFDARELDRWNIDRGALPAGSIIRFGQPTFWEVYRWHVMGAAAVILVQAALIVGLLFQRGYRRLAETSLQQGRSELARVSRAAVLGELTATLAHEVRQPLTAIEANAAAGENFMDADPPDLAEVRAALKDIAFDTRRAADVVDRLRAMLARSEPVVAPVDLNGIIRAVQRLLYTEAIEHRAAVQLELDPDLPLTLGDEVLFQQVILNLMMNAFTAMDGAQTAVRRLVLRTHSLNGTSVQVDVRDTGVGIPSDAVDHIFSPFVSSKPGGLGMGLAICRSIVERHGGHLWATNNPDTGATFSLELPAAPSSSSASSNSIAP